MKQPWLITNTYLSAVCFCWPQASELLLLLWLWLWLRLRLRIQHFISTSGATNTLVSVVASGAYCFITQRPCLFIISIHIRYSSSYFFFSLPLSPSLHISTLSSRIYEQPSILFYFVPDAKSIIAVNLAAFVASIDDAKYD